MTQQRIHVKLHRAHVRPHDIRSSCESPPRVHMRPHQTQSPREMLQYSGSNSDSSCTTDNSSILVVIVLRAVHFHLAETGRRKPTASTFNLNLRSEMSSLSGCHHCHRAARLCSPEAECSTTGPQVTM